MSLRKWTALACGFALSLSALSGCKASASFSAGGDEAESPETPPPPPPPKPKKEKEEPKVEPKAEKEEKKEEAKEEKGSKIVAKGNTIKLPGNIVFESGKANLKKDAGNEEILGQLRDYLTENKKVTLMRIEGHTDNVGKPQDNLELSGQRALTIKKFLIKEGVDEKRIIAIGFGETKPIADNATDEGRAQNRRTEFKIATVNDKPYLGMDPKAGGTEFK